ncbi:hypothetical protein HZB03_03175 [Candidatus Woesearchaeota archaeon]|nr:hypothetical protein [Candidatus Woesearchaeota archaeon]
MASHYKVWKVEYSYVAGHAFYGGLQSTTLYAIAENQDEALAKVRRQGYPRKVWITLREDVTEYVHAIDMPPLSAKDSENFSLDALLCQEDDKVTVSFIVKSKK